uniref:Uncharacterized protein n=1 Tax=Arundo donax TaxID=35708 RepID=A0A0A9HPN6_ARUDO
MGDESPVSLSLSLSLSALYLCVLVSLTYGSETPRPWPVLLAQCTVLCPFPKP